MVNFAACCVYPFEHQPGLHVRRAGFPPVLLARTPTEGWALLQACSPNRSMEGRSPADHNAQWWDSGEEPKVRTAVSGRVVKGSTLAPGVLQSARVLKVGEVL